MCSANKLKHLATTLLFVQDLETGKFLSPVCTTDVRRRITLSPNETHEFVVVLTPSRQMSSR